MNTILLCGGKGERLKPLTLEIPKPMVPVNGQPILYYILKRLANFNINKIHIAVGYKSSIIKDYLVSNFLNMDIRIIDDGDVDIIYRVRSLAEISQNEDMMILYGDTISDVNINDLIDFNKKDAKRNTITIHPLRTNFGIVEIDNNMNVVEFLEKPELDKWINIGYFILKKEFFKQLDKFNKFEDFLKFLSQAGSLNAFKHKGLHYTVNNFAELELLEQNIHKLKL